MSVPARLAATAPASAVMGAAPIHPLMAAPR
jgi:hypothetical protein